MRQTQEVESQDPMNVRMLREAGEEQQENTDSRLGAKAVPPSATGNPERGQPWAWVNEGSAEAEGQAPEIRKWNWGEGSGAELVVVRIQVGNSHHRRRE